MKSEFKEEESPSQSPPLQGGEGKMEEGIMKNKRRIYLDYSGILKKTIAEEGLSPREIKKYAPAVKKAVEKLTLRRASGSVGFADLAGDSENAREIQKYVSSVRGKYEFLVVLGIGGSALGPRALIDALAPPFYNFRSGSARHGWLKIIIADNISPEFIKGLFEVIPLTRTLFNVITKSGSTSETLSVFSIVRKKLAKRFGNDWKRRIVATTDADKGFLRDFVRKNSLKAFSIPSNVGGRFSALSSVGLFPAACAGIDIISLLEGASSVDKLCFGSNLFKNPSAMYAALNYIYYGRGRRINVFMPYHEGLATFSDWFAQLWAESLGKKENLLGKNVFVGPTPVKAKGVTDQHSQLQLYTEGPQDKLITLLSVDKLTSVKIPEIGDFVFSGRDLRELFRAEEIGTKLSLLEAHRPVLSIKMPEVNAFFLGQLILMLEVATAIYGEMLGINAFNQPGVEYGKIIAKKILAGKKVESAVKGVEKYCV